VLDAIERGTFAYADFFPNSKRAIAETKTSVLDFYLSRFLERTDLAPATVTNYTRIVDKELSPTLGNIPMHELTWTDIKECIRSFNPARARANAMLTVLRQTLNEAVDDGVIPSNPIYGRKLGRSFFEKKVAKESIDPFSMEEIDAIVSAATGQIKALIEFGFWTGLRPSELFALSWSDVDLVTGTVHVTHSLTLHAKELQDTKTSAGTRTVQLLPPALAVLKSQKALTYLKGEEVFQEPVGDAPTRWKSSNDLYRKWVTVLKRSGVRFRRPYQMRHTFCSQLLSAGEHPMWVSQQMGHSDWAFTAKTYSKFIPVESEDNGGKVMERWDTAQMLSNEAYT
jgi:integrase